MPGRQPDDTVPAAAERSRCSPRRPLPGISLGVSRTPDRSPAGHRRPSAPGTHRRKRSRQCFAACAADQKVSPAFLFFPVMGPLMHQCAIHCAVILRPLVFNVDQRPLPAAKHKMLQAGKLEEIVLVILSYAFFDTMRFVVRYQQNTAPPYSVLHAYSLRSHHIPRSTGIHHRQSLSCSTL